VGPSGVEVGGFVFGGDKAALQPDTGAARGGEEVDALGEPVEELPASGGPPEPVDEFVPGDGVLALGQAAGLRVEPQEHTTTLSMW
jgi:hypothetical protein